MTTEDLQKFTSILERCIKLSAGATEDVARQQRLEELIADFAESDNSPVRPVEHAAGWHFCVPSSFRAALDIKLTPRKVDGKTILKWTQGSWFHFQKGDTLYDSPKAYLPWDLNNFRICLDIRRASPAQPPNGLDRTTRYPGVIIFDVFTPNEDRTQLVKCRETTLSQDDFVKMLIIGPPAEWLELLSEKANDQ